MTNQLTAETRAKETLGKEQVRKGGLPPLADLAPTWRSSGGKPSFPTCSIPGFIYLLPSVKAGRLGG
jgi:hypothetical protein